MDTTITFKIKKELRDQAKQTAEKLGIPLSTIINAQLAKFVHEGRFEVALTPRPEKLEEWRALEEELEAHPEDEITLHSVREMREHFEKVWKETK